MNRMGNFFSNFKLNNAKINFGERKFSLDSSTKESAHIKANYEIEEKQELPKESAFVSFEEAVSHLVELYTAFSIRNNKGYEVQINRGKWNCKIVKDTILKYDYLQKGEIFNKNTCFFDSIFYIEDVDYKWYSQKRVSLKKEIE